jgi:hypothetical protein
MTDNLIFAACLAKDFVLIVSKYNDLARLGAVPDQVFSGQTGFLPGNKKSRRCFESTPGF